MPAAAPPPEITHRSLAIVQGRMHAAWKAGLAPWQVIVGENGSGKTGLITRVIYPLCAHDRVLAIDVKGDDPMMRGYGKPVSRVTPGFHGDGEGPGRNWYRLVVDPVNDKKGARREVGAALDLALTEGHMVLIVDETRAITDNDELALRPALEAAILRGRSRNLSGVMAAQATEYMVPSVRNQWAIAWLGPLKDEHVIRRALEIGTLPRSYAPLIRDMPRRRWLYMDKESGPPTMALTDS